MQLLYTHILDNRDVLFSINTLCCLITYTHPFDFHPLVVVIVVVVISGGGNVFG